MSHIEHREQSKHSNILDEMTEKENTIANGFNLDSYFGFIVSSVSVVCVCVRTAHAEDEKSEEIWWLVAYSDQKYGISMARNKQKKRNRCKDAQYERY